MNEILYVHVCAFFFFRSPDIHNSIDVAFDESWFFLIIDWRDEIAVQFLSENVID